MDAEGYERTVSEMMRLWIYPEIQRRREAEVLPDAFQLNAAQIVVPAPQDGRHMIIRLNDEVRLEACVETGGPQEIGDVLEIADVDSISSVSLPKSDSNCGHMSLMRFHAGWMLFFDFRYNRARAAEHLAAAREFLACATDAISANHLRAACDLLFSAAELLAKAELLTIPDPKIGTHRAVGKKFNAWVKLGNAPVPAASALNTLAGLRDAARYLKAPLTVSQDRLTEIAEAVEDNAARVENHLQ